MKVNLNMNVSKVVSEKEKNIKKAQWLLNQRVLADSNYYVPEDTGTLKDSGIIGSSGDVVEWNSIYAKKQYYENNNKSRDKNPNATYKWFEFAKAKKLKDWLRIANVGYNKRG